MNTDLMICMIIRDSCLSTQSPNIHGPGECRNRQHIEVSSTVYRLYTKQYRTNMKLGNLEISVHSKISLLWFMLSFSNICALHSDVLGSAVHSRASYWKKKRIHLSALWEYLCSVSSDAFKWYHIFDISKLEHLSMVYRQFSLSNASKSCLCEGNRHWNDADAWKTLYACLIRSNFYGNGDWDGDVSMER